MVISSDGVDPATGVVQQSSDTGMGGQLPTGQVHGQAPGQAQQPVHQAPGADWRSTLPPGWANAPYIREAPDPNAALQAIANAAQYQGQSLRIPRADDPQEARDKFYEKVSSQVPGLERLPDDLSAVQNLYGVMDKLGRPKQAQDYGAIEGIDDPELLGRWHSEAHTDGLTKAQFQQMATRRVQEQEQAERERQLRHQQGMAQLNGEWGQTAEQRRYDAERAAIAVGAEPELIQALREGQASAEAYRMFYNISTRLNVGEGTEARDQPNNMGEPVMSPVEAEQKIADLMRKAYDPNTLPDEKVRLLRQIAMLERFAHPENAIPEDVMMQRLGTGYR